jgi:hypothetical protein
VCWPRAANDPPWLGQVGLYLYRDGEPVHTIVKAVRNLGKYIFTFPEVPAPSDSPPLRPALRSSAARSLCAPCALLARSRPPTRRRRPRCAPTRRARARQCPPDWVYVKKRFFAGALTIRWAMRFQVFSPAEEAYQILVIAEEPRMPSVRALRAPRDLLGYYCNLGAFLETSPHFRFLSR